MSMGRLAGKVAIITGAAGGIGTAAARTFAAEGALLLTDAGSDRAGRLAAELRERACGSGHDVTSAGDWEAVVHLALQTHGQIDILVNNAGVFLAAPLPQTSIEDFRRVMDVNIVGVFLGMRAVAAPMSERRTGSIINFSSVAGLIGSPYLTAYAARIGTPQEVADALLDLASDESSYTTGAELVLDGGTTA